MVECTNKLCAAARQILEDKGSDAVSLGEAARRAGVPETAALVRFASSEALLADVAADGFDDLAAALQAAADSDDPLIGVGLAYLEFATTRRGLFGAMFGPLLAERERYPTLDRAAGTMFVALERALALVEANPATDDASATARGLIGGLSHLVASGMGSPVVSRPARPLAGTGVGPMRAPTPRERWTLN